VATIKLGKMTHVDLREVFSNEAYDFTPWLAQEENLAHLGEVIGLDLELEAQEKDVGPFKADILCKDTASDEWVLIENQIEKTDHKHLGQLLTYAAGLDAVTIIWIAQHFTEDHRAALDWLNRKTDKSIRFFGLEVELWKIGNSEVAPKFNIKSQPNDWSAEVQTAASQAINESETKQLQLRFWIEFRKFMEDSKSHIKCQKPSPQHWMNHPIGKVGFHLASIISSGKGNASGNGPEVRVELIVDGKKRYDALLQHKGEIEKQIEEELYWHNPEDKNSSRIYVRKGGDFSNPENWSDLQNWLKKELELFQSVFGPIIKNMDHSVFKK
jgi:hypothetical protein